MKAAAVEAKEAKEALERERELAAAWAVGADARRAERETQAAARAAKRNAAVGQKDEAVEREAAEFSSASKIVNATLQRKNHSDHDLFGMALIEEEAARARKRTPPKTPKATTPRSSSASNLAGIVFGDPIALSDGPRNSNAPWAGDDEGAARPLAGSRSAGSLTALAPSPRAKKRTPKGAARAWLETSRAGDAGVAIG